MLLLLAGLATAGSWQWRADLGGQIDPSPHGVADLGLRRGVFSVQLLTDTLDVRWAPEGEQGRWWVAARGEGGAAGLLISPWTDGAPDPSRALAASYGGVEGGGLFYLPRGVYAGGQASVRAYVFQALETTVVAVPEPRLLATPEALLGYWRPQVQGWVRAGADLGPGVFAPHVAGEVTGLPEWTVAPRVELRAGWAADQDELTRTRLGGVNPYVVPLAGAGWAEFWVEQYAAVRLGPDWRPEIGESALDFAAVADLVGFDGRTEAGFAGLAGWRRGSLFLDTALGYAPWLEREEGFSRLAVWFLVGTAWRP